MLFATIFLVCFVILGGVVMFLSRTIEHGEARFDANGKEIRDEPAAKGPVKPAQRLENSDTHDDPIGQVKNDE